jgi:2-dehydropantoate 2-reductase
VRVAVFGAGAVGAFVGAKLLLSGNDVTLIARGENLEALRARGLSLETNDGTSTRICPVRATDDVSEVEPQDIVILAVKAHQLGAIVNDVQRITRSDTTVVTMQNGIPYWYFYNHGVAHAGRIVESVDPGGTIMQGISPHLVVGCVVYPATVLVAPGVVRHVEGDRFPIGELDGVTRTRTKQLSEYFISAGFKAPILTDIRSEIWLKLWGNLTFNPISALTRATIEQICRDRGTRELAAAMMSEAQALAGGLGITFRVDLERRIAGAERVGNHKTSMLQDVEGRKRLEIEALVGSVVELARLTEVPVPHIQAVYALTKLLDRVHVAKDSSKNSHHEAQAYSVITQPGVASCGLNYS